MQRIFISGIVLAFALSACSKKDKTKGDDEKPTTAKVQEAKPKQAEKAPKLEIKTGDDVAKRAMECFKFGAAKQVDKMKTCYTADMTATMVDFVPPMVTKGWDSMVKNAEQYWKAFPDQNFEPHLLLVNGTDGIVIGLYTGTNSGEFMGMPATNKKVGVLGGNHFKMNAQGQISEENTFVDQSTWNGQLMGGDYPLRPVMEKTGKAPTILVAKNDETEKKNIAMLKEMSAAFNAHDHAKAIGYYADDSKFVYIASPQDLESKEAISKGLGDYFKMSSDLKSELKWMWGAGDYVVGRFIIAGTNDGPLPHGGKATNKPFTSDELNIYKIQDGKIKEHWIYSNSFSMAVQLGMAPDPAEMMKQGGGDADNKAPEKAPAKKG